MTVIDKLQPESTTDPISKISNEDEGRYTVTTQTGSRYIIDMNDRTLSRHRGDESDWHGDLTRTGIEHGIINLANCAVGEGMVVIIDEALPGIKEEIGARFTTTVVSIEAA